LASSIDFLNTNRPEGMDLAESTVHSFIVKLWLEDEAGETGRRWQGYITHVPSGARRHFKKLSDITDFIKEYVDGNQARATRRSKLRGWLRRFVLESGHTRLN
jgi:hypothetical protein